MAYINVASKQLVKNPVLELILMFILIHNFAPFIGEKTPATLYGMIIILFYIVAIFSFGYADFKRYFIYSLPMLSIPLLDVFFRGEFSSSNFIVRFYGFLQSMIYPIYAIHLLETNDRKQAIRLFVLILVLFTITSITTYIGCSIIPQASRLLATNFEENQELYHQICELNIGGFTFIYTIVLSMPLLICLYKNGNLTIGILLILLVVYGFAVVKSEYSTALLCFLIAALTIILRKNLDNKTFKRYLLYIIVIAFLGSSVISLIISTIASNTESTIVSDRLRDISVLLSGGSATLSDESDISSRIELFQTSLNTFTSSFFLGGWSSNKIGGHSLFFDVLGMYGLIGLWMFILTFKRIYQAFFSYSNNEKWFGYPLMVFVLAIVLAVLNPEGNIFTLSLFVTLFGLIIKGKNENSYS